ncbi:hypothetical protein N431DRAFT_545139 [Stipitochalara longipes BDJ]|nr:hypothetical protein N431DRAFT_545139 [Stipitochalara longipes BDJ]
MRSFTIATILSLAVVAYAVPPFDPAGAKNVGNGAGGQFIGGQCLSNADCGSGCCANPTGICSGPGAATQNGKQGCGFGSTGSSSAVAVAAAASPSVPTASVASTASAGGPAFDPAGAKNVGNGKGIQFIGGQCLSGADCASTCCAGPSGICSGLGAQLQAGKTGCGFVSGSSSGGVSSAAVAAPAASSAPAAPAAANNAVASTASAGGPAFDPAGAKNVGNGAGIQFIGGQCLSGADCASTCCAGPSGICSGLGAQLQAGKTGCGFVSGSASGAAAAAPVASSAAVAKPASSASAGGPAFDPAGVKNVGNGKGVQFIGGQCLSGADCASTCCAGPSGICSGLGAQTQAGKTGCGFVSTKKLLRV